jgi:ABC-type antimicrobial peptide transport system permease subunit
VGVLASPSVTLRQIVAQESSQERTVSLLLAYAAALCLLIAVIGTYGLTAFEVAGRQREIAVRIALGGTPAGVVVVFVARGAKLAALGLLCGAALGYAAQQLSGVLPFGQPGANPAASLAAASIILVATTAGAVVAAFRRARVDPSVVLRSE